MLLTKKQKLKILIAAKSLYEDKIYETGTNGSFCVCLCIKKIWRIYHILPIISVLSEFDMLKHAPKLEDIPKRSYPVSYSNNWYEYNYEGYIQRIGLFNKLIADHDR